MIEEHAERLRWTISVCEQAAMTLGAYMNHSYLRYVGIAVQ